MKPWQWSATEQDVLRSLALRIRLITASQIAHGWFPNQADADGSAQQVIQRLEAASLITRRWVEAHPLLGLRRPLFAWKVGKPPPSERQFQIIAAQTRNRWTQSQTLVEVFFADKQATSLFGAFVDARHFKNCEATHDLHLTEVYLQYRQRTPGLARCWQGEAAFPKMGLEISRMKDPDAFVIGRKGAASRIVEFAGSYEEDHLRDFHVHCAGGAAKRLSAHGWGQSTNRMTILYSPRGTSYELW